MLNLTYNALLDGVRLEDIELRRRRGRSSTGGAQASGSDHQRRLHASFWEGDIVDLMEGDQSRCGSGCGGEYRGGAFREAFIDTDGTIARPRGVQGRDGAFLQRDVGLCAAGDLWRTPRKCSIWSTVPAIPSATRAV